MISAWHGLDRRVRFAAWHGIAVEPVWSSTANGEPDGATILWADGNTTSLPVRALADAGPRMPWLMGRWRISRTPVLSAAGILAPLRWRWQWVVTFPWPVNGMARTEVVASQQAGLALIEQARRERWNGA